MDTPRVIFINGYEFNKALNYPDNYISSTKYNLITFLPKCLFQQFRRIANIYFLIVAVLQSISIISPLQPFSAIAPFAFVIGVSMIREAFEDYRRYRSDCETNSLEFLKYTKKFESTPSMKLKVGDIIMIKKDQVFPCDLIFLGSSEDSGVGFIETSSLDGEKTLKSRKAFAHTYEAIKEKGIIRLFNLLEIEKPNPRIYQFNGLIYYNNKKYPLDKDNLLLAGSFLRNTQWVIGVAVYTGPETKLRMNLMDRTFKQSTIERKVNNYIIFIILLQFGMCCVPAFLGGYNSKDWESNYYLQSDTIAWVSGLLLFFTYFLLMNTMLPISLIISLELIKVVQAYFMEKSLDMYSVSKNRTCKVFSSSLNEELGMIKHVFTDKTGTLTCNQMKFAYCTVGQRLYAYSDTSIDENINSYSLPDLKEDLYGPVKDDFKPFRMAMGHLVLEIKDQKQLTDQFLKCMSMCHQCIVDRDSGNYIGASPDEICLLKTSSEIGYAYQNPFQNKIQLKINPYSQKSLQVIENFEFFCVLEFSSDRKRNSVILRDLSTGFIILYTKGADSVIIQRLSTSNSKSNLDKITDDLLYYSKKGYRTLLLGFRIISEQEFKLWKIKYDEACTSVYDREGMIDRLAEEIEKDLVLLGCTAVEDSLQDQVPDTIQDIISAGIKIWMLTGDKLETAINIAKTCGLAQENSLIFKFKSSDSIKCEEKLRKSIQATQASSDAIIVIEGQSLEVLLSENKCVELFFQLTEGCKTVICCRVSPGQKKKMVSAVKSKYNHISLAVGDGANDVSMILEASIGVGIYGEEGMQAVQASDYAIGEFRFLWDLILNHGRINYIRQSEMIL
jgi:phospholipid-translocating P-type ATPase (flippase)